VDLSNMRGGPDNITVIIVRVGGEGGEAVPAGVPPKPLLARIPWWVGGLVAGILLAVAATFLVRVGWEGLAVLAFVLSLAGFVSGIVGLVFHYRRVQHEDSGDDDRPPAKPHRRRSCKIERPILDKLIRALKTLRQRADENHWEPDWNLFQTHQTAADDLLAHNDIAGAFREYCRAMLPLTRALHERRQKEEVFQPVWDKTR
jgi:protein phosphatase